MHKSVSVTKFARNVSGYLDQVRYTGEIFSITKGAKIVAELMPPKPTGLPISELVRLIEEAPSLSEDTSRMKEDLKKLREASKKPLDDPWA